MVQKKRKHSAASGRASPIIDLDARWHRSAVADLAEARRLSVAACPDRQGDIDFATEWAKQWLWSFDAGHCDLPELLKRVNAGASNVPAPWSRLILGTVAYRAMQTTPKDLGEWTSRTVPAVPRLVGSLVDSIMFDEKGQQQCTTDEAVAAAAKLIKEKDLLGYVPTDDTIRTWYEEWRDREEADGFPVNRPSVGFRAKRS